MQCPICGKDFKAYSGLHRYCSDQCRLQGAKEHTTVFNPLERELITIDCAICGKPFLAPTHKYKYCSYDCAKTAEAEQRRQAKENARRRAALAARGKSKSINEIVKLAKEAGLSYGYYVSEYDK